MKKNNLLFMIFILLLLSFTIAAFLHRMERMELQEIDTNTLNPTAVLTVLLDLVCLVIILRCRLLKKIKMKGISIIALLWLLIIPVTLTLAEFALKPNLAYVIFWPLTFFAFFYLVRNDLSFFFKMQKFFILVFCVTGLLFLYARNLTIVDFLKQINVVFFPLLTMPWILLTKKTIVRNILIGIVFLLALFSLKRSAILAVVIAIVPYIFSYLKYWNKGLGIIMIFVFFILLGGAFYKVNQMVGNTVIERFNNIDDDSGSGRLLIYERVLDLQKESSNYEWVFGHGHYGVKRNAFFLMSAHNEFLEILYDYGIIIFILYIFLWIHVIKRLIHLKKEKSLLYHSYFAGFAIFFVMSMVSHLILYANYFIFLTIYWGAIEGIKYKQITSWKYY